MARRFRIKKSVRSWCLANIILENGLFDEWRIYCYRHPKIKSKYRLANLFLMNKKLLYKPVSNPVDVNMENLEAYFYD